MLQEDRENMLGKINVAGCMSKQTTTFMDILIYKWNLPLSVNMWDECQSQYLVCNLYGIPCEIPSPYGVHAKYSSYYPSQNIDQYIWLFKNVVVNFI